MASLSTLSSTRRSCWPVTQFLILEQTAKSSPVNLFLSIKIQLRLLIENNARISSPACENSRLSLLLGARDVAPGETSARQQQEFHTHDVEQCLHNLYGSREVLNVNLFYFCLSWTIMVKFCVFLRISKTQMFPPINKSIFHEYWLFCSKFIAVTFHICGGLSFVCRSQTTAKTI